MEDSATSSLVEPSSAFPIAVTRRFLVIEDDPDVSDALRSFVELHRPALVASNLAEARDRFSQQDIGAVILDESLPDGSGLSWLEEVRTAGWNGPVLMLTGHLEREIANRAQTLRAHCVFKPADPANIAHFVEQVLRREADSEERIEKALQAFVAHHGVTPRETDTLRAACRGVSRAELHAVLGVSENTAKSLVRTLLKRAGAKNLDEVIERILRQVVDDVAAT